MHLPCEKEVISTLLLNLKNYPRTEAAVRTSVHRGAQGTVHLATGHRKPPAHWALSDSHA